MFRFYHISLVALLCALSLQVADACTSVVVSGKVTKDGRPLLFKNRDTGNVKNFMKEVQGEKYRYLAVVADGDSLPRSAWSGHNETGFAIINTAAYNLNGVPKQNSAEEAALSAPKPGQSGSRGPRLLNDGAIMRRALEVCASLQDFELFLDTLTNATANSNYGVIDAHGGAAYYEVGNVKESSDHRVRYVKFDANDPTVAPYGYIIRTNHGYSGEREVDKGIERYLAIAEYMLPLGFTYGYDARKFITEIPRTLRHGLTKLDIRDFAPADRNTQQFFPFRDFIPRYLTSCSQLIQGVAEGQDPGLTVAWTITGSPLATVAIPLILHPGVRLPLLVTDADQGGSKLCHWGLELKKQLFPMNRGSYQDYIDVAALYNQAQTGILQVILGAEREVLDTAQPLLDENQALGKVNTQTWNKYYQWVDTYLEGFYAAQFGLK